jgi:hypothetical protein
MVSYRRGTFFVSKQFFERSISMKTYQTLFIGVTAICLFAVCAVPASAAVPTKAVAKAKDFITRVTTSLGNAIWNNKGSVAVGSVAVAVATNPAPFVSGATTMITGRPSDPSATGIRSYFTSWLFYLIATVLAIIGVRCSWNYVKDYKNWLPLMVVGVLLTCGGVVQAGMIDYVPVPEVPLTGIKPPPFWDVIGLIILILTIFIGV